MGNDPSTFSTCEITSSFDVNNPNPWTLHGGVCKDGTNVSVFLYESEQIKKSIIENTVRNLKTLKHPGIIKYLSVKYVKDDTWIITDSVVPLESVIDTLTPEEICAGIHNLLQVLAFLHQAGICHNNLGWSSVFVSTDGSWKLGCVDWLCKFTEATPSYLATAAKWRRAQAVAPEEKSKDFVPTVSDGYTRDVYAFGHLAGQLLEYMTSLGDLTMTFQSCIEDKCLSSDPEQRPQVLTLLEDRLFRCDYVDIVQFLKTFTLQGDTDRQSFFSGLVERLYKLPAELVALRLTRPLLARFVLLEKSAVDHVIPHLLTPAHGKDRPNEYRPGQSNPLFLEYLFKKHVIPELFKIFHVRDAHIRIVLLTHFSSYAKLFGRDLLKSTILPQILLGVRDTNDRLVSLSLRALSDLVDILGGDIVIGVNRVKVFTDGLPKSQTQKLENGVLHKKDKKPVNIKVSDKQSSPEKEERERRRQEARKRMDERKKRREERKSQEPVPSPHTHSLESDDGGPADINKVRSDKEESVTMDRMNESNSTKQEVDENETGSDGELNDTYKTESDIDLEIEAELEAMESTLNPKRMVKVGSETTGEVIKVDWSDVPNGGSSPQKKNELDNTKGVLKLSAACKKLRRTSPIPVVKPDLNKERNSQVGERYSHSSQRSGSGDENSGSEGDWGENWDESNNKVTEQNSWDDENWSDNTKVSPKFKVSGKKTGEKSTQKVGGGTAEKSDRTAIINKAKSTTSSSKNQGLGAEYDIMAVDIKTSIREMDYFADMMPDFKPKAGDLYSALGLSDSAGQSKDHKRNSPQKSTISFAVVDTEDTNEGGWDVDDWEES